MYLTFFKDPLLGFLPPQHFQVLEYASHYFIDMVLKKKTFERRIELDQVHLSLDNGLKRMAKKKHWSQVLNIKDDYLDLQW